MYNTAMNHFWTNRIGLVALVSLALFTAGANLCAQGFERPTWRETQTFAESTRFIQQQQEVRRRANIQHQINLRNYLRSYRWDGFRASQYAFPPPPPAGFRPVFETWPVVPGDLWGFGWYESEPQPVRQQQIQTGPNRWESFPVYRYPQLPSRLPPRTPESGPEPPPKQPAVEQLPPPTQPVPPRQPPGRPTPPRREGERSA